MQLSDNWSTDFVTLTLNKYKCSTCFSHLTEIRRDHHSYIVCAKHPEEHEGFVTASYVDKARSRSKEEAYEVKERLEELGIIDKKKTNLTAEQIINSLY